MTNSGDGSSGSSSGQNAETEEGLRACDQDGKENEDNDDPCESCKIMISMMGSFHFASHCVSFGQGVVKHAEQLTRHFVIGDGI